MQRFGFQTAAMTGGAGDIAAIPGEKDTHMHAVGSGVSTQRNHSQAFKVLMPVNDVLFLRVAELGKRHIDWDILLGAEFQEHAAFVACRLGTPGFNRPSCNSCADRE